MYLCGLEVCTVPEPVEESGGGPSTQLGEPPGTARLGINRYGYSSGNSWDCPLIYARMNLSLQDQR